MSWGLPHPVPGLLVLLIHALSWLFRLRRMDLPPPRQLAPSLQGPWSELRKHKASCTQTSGCTCALFIELFPKWAEALPLNPAPPPPDANPSVGITWLAWNLPAANDDKGSVTYCCLACAGWECKSCRFGNFKRHAESAAHQRNVARMLGTRPGDNLTSAPPVALFKKVFANFQQGVAPSACTAHQLVGGARLGKDKMGKVLWALSEAAKQEQQRHVREAVCLNLLRDERHGRLHFRFRCANAAAEMHCGYMGQARDFGQHAVELTAATEHVLRDFCTLRQGHRTEHFDAELFEHIRVITEAITVDSASNEQVASADMSSGQTQRGSALTPNCKYVLLDCPHKARRVLSRPWKADPVLDSVISLFCHSRDSMGQLIHHSSELRKLYKQCVDETAEDSCVSTRFANLRCAKHRIETEVTPLSRSLLNLSAFILFAVRLSQLRKGEREGKAACVFLESLSPTLVLLLAMMADAGIESLSFIRMMDTEELPVSDLALEVQGFLDRVTWLFHQGGCEKVPGHTQFALEWLSTPHFYLIPGVGGRCIGGSPPSEATLNTAYRHIRGWTVLARDVLKAEFPDFDLVCAFSVFTVPKDMATALPVDVLTKLSRLAQSFDLPQLRDEYEDHLPLAVAARARSGCSHLASWVEALRINSKVRGAIIAHPSKQMWHALQRYACFSPSTSAVEQSFSKLALRLPAQRLNASAASEMQSARLLLAKLSATELESMCSNAQQVWKRAFPAGYREHTQPRVDLGLPKKRVLQNDLAHDGDTGTKLTEGRFVKRCLQATRAASQAEAGCSDRCLDQGRMTAWTAAHDKERQFNEAKRQRRLVEALRRDSNKVIGRFNIP
jgi:hypothetical protein